MPSGGATRRSRHVAPPGHSGSLSGRARRRADVTTTGRHPARRTRIPRRWCRELLGRGARAMLTARRRNRGPAAGAHREAVAAPTVGTGADAGTMAATAPMTTAAATPAGTTAGASTAAATTSASSTASAGSATSTCAATAPTPATGVCNDGRDCQQQNSEADRKGPIDFHMVFASLRTREKVSMRRASGPCNNFTAPAKKISGRPLRVSRCRHAADATEEVLLRKLGSPDAF